MALVTIGEGAVKPLVDALRASGESDRAFRDRLVDVIRLCEGRAPHVIQLVRDGPTWLLDEAIALALDLESVEALDAIATRLVDDPHVEALCLDGALPIVAKKLGAAAVSALVRLVEKGSAHHALAAAAALGAIGARDGAAAIAERLARDDEIDRRALSDALGLTDPAVGFARVSAALSRARARSTPDLQRSLWRIDPARTVALFVDAVRAEAARWPDDPEVDVSLAFALPLRVGAAAVAPAIAALGDPLASVRLALVELLRHVRNDDANAALTRIASYDESAAVRALAAKTLD